MPAFHPDLAQLARVLPRRGLTSARWLPLLRRLQALQRDKSIAGVDVSDIREPVPLRVYRPIDHRSRAALLWIHGGGLVMGQAKMDDQFAGRLARELGILVASVDYRLAPEHPYPAPLDDCWDGLQWLLRKGDVDPTRVAVGGASAGGGLAAALAQLAHDRGVGLSFQLLVYPMLDDRSAVRPGVDGRDFRLWSQASNRFGWASYLGAEPGAPDVAAPAAPARRVDLTGLAPAWIGVGTNDLFHDEDGDYARRLLEAGVDCELHVVDGAYHGFDATAGRAPVSRAFRTAQILAVRRGLGLD